jgi:hypothetical protein
MGDNTRLWTRLGDFMKNIELWRTVGIVAMFVGGFLGNAGHDLAWLVAVAGAVLTIWATIKWWKQL